MKNFFLLGIVALSIVPVVMAREAMLPDPAVVIDTGEITDHTLIASAGGEVFIEFSTATRFVHEEGLISFSGEILPPTIIDIPDERPRVRMDPLISFELITDSGEPILFADRFDLKTARNRLREQYLNPESIVSSSWVKLVIPIEDPAIGRPQLWEYIGSDEGWATIGGILDEPTPEGVRIFSAILRRTGVYTVFDEAPSPKHYANEFDGSMTHASASVISDEDFWNESNGELPEGMTWEELQSLTIDGKIVSREEYRNIDTIPEAGISVADRSITVSEKIALEARKIQLISQVSRETVPESIVLLRELLTLIERKILIADQREQLLSRKAQLEKAIPAANTEKLRADLTDQLARVEAQLRNLEDVKLELRIKEIEETLHFSYKKETVIHKSAPEVVDETEEELEIPVEAELPKSGADEGSTPSMVFPLALLAVIIFVIASAVIASRKKHSL